MCIKERQQRVDPARQNHDLGGRGMTVTGRSLLDAHENKHLILRADETRRLLGVDRIRTE